MIDQDVVDQYLDTLLGHSEPGQSTHHLLVAVQSPAGSSPLGVTGLEVHLYALVPAGDTVGRLVAQAIMKAVTDSRLQHTPIHFLGLALEVFAVYDDGDEVTANRAHLLAGEKRLQEHPKAVEVTQMYAACRDGRRWFGKQALTGPNAGQKTGPLLMAGDADIQEGGIHQRLIRAAVGLEPMPGPAGWQR